MLFNYKMHSRNAFFSILFVIICSTTQPLGAQSPPPPSCETISNFNSEPSFFDGTDNSRVAYVKLPEGSELAKLDLEFDRSLTSIASRTKDNVKVTGQLFKLVYPRVGMNVTFIAKYHLDDGMEEPNLVNVKYNDKVLCHNDIGGRSGTQDIVPLCRYNTDLIEEHKKEETQRLSSMTIKLKSKEDKTEAKVRIMFSKSIYILANEKYQSKTVDSQNFTVTIKDEFKADEDFNFKFFITFDDLQKRPQIETIYLDELIICSDHKVDPIADDKTDLNTSPKNKTTVKRRTATLPVPLNPEQFFAWLITSPTPKPIQDTVERENDEDMDALFNCRNNNQLRSISEDRIGGGLTAEREQFPWHSAIFHRNAMQSFEYQCGGTLITRRVVLTAAHCVVTANSIKLWEPDFLIYLGLYNLQREMGGEQIRKVKEIIVHRDYARDGLYSDIAVMKLTEAADISPTVTPVCLWSQQDDIANGFDKLKGTVPGWGLNENGEINEYLTFLEMPVVPRTICLNKNRKFYTPLLNGLTYCAGDGSGKSVCNGDSGGGMVFHDAENNIWRLRGVVSASIKQANTDICDLNFYAIFTDVSKFLPWITNSSLSVVNKPPVKVRQRFTSTPTNRFYL